MKFDTTLGTGMILLTNDLNISTTMSLGEIAFSGIQDPFVVQPPLSSEQRAQLSGLFTLHDASTSELFQLRPFVVGSKFPALEILIRGKAVQAVRLLSRGPGRFAVTNGIQQQDFVTFKKDEQGRSVLIYAQYESVGADGKVNYEETIFQKD
ncbi:MAG: hypothetical protein H7222_14895 [Methylotenera sp.]|nr:hypothetical protein [Oligoflexia bacterium]